ncbi:MAG: hypothetical protein ACRDQA_30965, partial [Nocardioidaceae bacterium]
PTPTVERFAAAYVDHVAGPVLEAGRPSTVNGTLRALRRTQRGRERSSSGIGSRARCAAVRQRDEQ